MIRGERKMADDPIAAARKSSESWYWWGIPTYFRCPWNEDHAAADIALVGGDHSITGGIPKAIAGPGRKISGGRPAALVHFDAHTDSYENMPHWLGAVRSAAHWAAYTVREDSVDSSRSLQIGIRGHPSKVIHTDKVGTASKGLGYQVITLAEFEELGIQKTIEKIRARVGDAPVNVPF